MTIAAAEGAYRARRRARLAATLAGGAVLMACLLVSAIVSEASPEALAKGLPRVGEYFAKLVPPLQWRHLLDGVKTEGSLAFWFYRLDAWAWMLFETSQIALLATLGGAAVALPLSFLAAANIAPNRATYLI